MEDTPYTVRRDERGWTVVKDGQDPIVTFWDTVTWAETEARTYADALNEQVAAS